MFEICLKIYGYYLGDSLDNFIKFRGEDFVLKGKKKAKKVDAAPKDIHDEGSSSSQHLNDGNHFNQNYQISTSSLAQHSPPVEFTLPTVPFNDNIDCYDAQASFLGTPRHQTEVESSQRITMNLLLPVIHPVMPVDNDDDVGDLTVLGKNL